MKSAFFGGIGVALASLLATAAQATPLTGSFAINVWYGLNSSTPHQITDPTEQALPNNPLASTTPLYSGTYNGPVLFSDATTGGTGNILSFLTSNGGTLSGSSSALNHLMSQGNFADATLIEITFTTAQKISGTVKHDDGISIYDATNTTPFVDASAPTTLAATSFDLPGGATYNLWYAEVNGTPAQLNFDIPEPASLALIGSGMVATGLLRQRRRPRCQA